MNRLQRLSNLPSVASAQGPCAVGEGIEYTPAFQELDALVNEHDADGAGPLRKGERPLQWEAVEQAAEALLRRCAVGARPIFLRCAR